MHDECFECGIPFDEEHPLFHEDEDNDIGYCESCYNELFGEDDDQEWNDENVFARVRRRDDPQIQQEVDDTKDTPENFSALPLLKSNRSFGVELEMFGGNVEAIQQFCSEKRHAYEHDGSIVGQNPVEVASKVFQGQQGGKEFLELAEVSKKLGFKTNFSCGTHVHLGAKDFFTNELFKEYDMSSMPNNDDNIVILVELPLLVQMRKAMNTETILTDFIQEASLNYDDRRGWFANYTMYDGRTSNICLVPCQFMGRNYLILMRVSTLDRQKLKPMELVQHRMRLELGEDTTEARKMPNKGMVATIAVDKVVPFSKPYSKHWSKLKSLFAFYSYFDELLFAMLPSRRRNSVYCKPLRETYALSDILDCDSQENIEMTWYKAKDLREVSYAKQQRGSLDSKYNSRYHSVNIHSLFYQHGTIEIRLHHGTTNGNSVLAWVVLHQRILDMIANGEVDWRRIAELDRRASRQKKAYMFKRLLNLKEEPELLRFVSHRLNHYSKIILK